MSKIICIPGSTTFRPLDDIISIDVHVKLQETVEVLPPNSSASDFMLGSRTQIKTFVVTTYAVDRNKSDADDDDEKSYDIEKRIFEIDALDVDAENSELQLLTENEIYINLPQKTRDQIDVRIDKYKEFMQYEEAQTELGDKLDNVAPIAEPSASTSEIVEEEDAPTEPRTPRILENLNPDRQKLEEIGQWLSENFEKQSKRLPYLEEKFKRSVTILEAADGYEFVAKLNGLSYSEDLIKQVENVIQKTVDAVSNIVG